MLHNFTCSLINKNMDEENTDFGLYRLKEGNNDQVCELYAHIQEAYLTDLLVTLSKM